MQKKIFDDIPGVGEILMYQKEFESPITGEFKRAKNLWLDDLAFKQLELGRPVAFHEFNEIGGIELLRNALNMPFIKIENRHISFSLEKHHIAAILIATYDSILNKKDLKMQTSLMPYDHINYFRPVIEASDYKLIVDAIENSINPNYIRFLFLLLRRCAVQGENSWAPWLQKYIDNLPDEINSYPEFTVQRDSRVTYTIIKGKEYLFPFVERIMNDVKLMEYERKHFIESLGSPQRAGEVLYWKIIESGYRQEIAPINIFSIHFFPSEHIKTLLGKISIENESKKIRDLAKKALELCNKQV